MLIRVPTMAVLRGPKRLKTFATSMLYTPVPTIASEPTNAAGKKRIAVKCQMNHMVHQSPRAVSTGFGSMERSFLILDSMLVHPRELQGGGAVRQFPGPRNFFPSFQALNFPITGIYGEISVRDAG